MKSSSTSTGVVRTGACPELTTASVLVGYFLGAVIVVSILIVNWSWFVPILALGVAALYVFRKAHHGEAKASHRISGNLQTLDSKPCQNPGKP